MNQVEAFRTKWLWPGFGPVGGEAWVTLRYQVVSQISSRRPWGVACRDLGPGLLMPGLVNAHTHTELAFLQGQAKPAGDFVGWLEDLVLARPGHDQARAKQAAMAAAEQMHACGTVLVGDITNTGRAREVLWEAGLSAVSFFEALGQANAEPPPVELSWREGRLLASACAAHAPYSVPPERIQRLKARAGNLPFAIHVAESVAECQLIAGQGSEGERLADFLAKRGVDVNSLEFAGATPLSHLLALGVLDWNTLLVHGVRIEPGEIASLAQSRASLCICPRSNLGLTGTMAPVPDLLAAGVNLALGTDSLASCPDLDLFQEMKVLLEHFEGLSPQDVLNMATGGGSRALGLGLGECYGGIGQGMRGILCFVPLSQDLGADEVLAAVAHGDHAGPVELVG